MTATQPRRPAFTPATLHLLDCADVVCARHGSQLTTLRRTVLGLVIESARPAGAYELLQRLSAAAGRAAPPTIYRALAFLIAEGLVHKVERLAAYVACTHHLHHDHAHPPHGQSVQFLICTQCGRAIELEHAAVGAALRQGAEAAGFRLHTATIEAAGLCAACAAAAPTPGG